MKKYLTFPLFWVALLALSGCSAEPGTKAWCDSLVEKRKGDWTANEAATYTKYCVLKNYKAD